MADNEHAETHTETQQDEAILAIGVLGIVNKERMFIGEDCQRFLEANAMLPLIACAFAWVPLEADFSHDEIYVQCMY